MPSFLRALASFLALLTVLIGSAAAYAQDDYSRQAGEYALSGPLPGDQTRPALAFGPTGGYVVWQDNVTDGDGSGISAQRLNDNLSGTLAPFRVNQMAAGYQEFPQVAVLPNGGVVFVWQGGALGFQKIYARFMNADGTFATDDILVGADTNQPSLHPAVAVLTSGEVVVVWSRMEGDGHLQGICARRLSSAGGLLGPEWVVNQTATYNQSKPAVGALAGGGFAVAWVSESIRGSDPLVAEGGTDAIAVDILARRFDAVAQPVAGEFKVNTQTYLCNHPALAPTAAGGFTVVWEQRDAAVRTNGLDVLARTYDNNGVPIAAPAVVNATGYGDQYAPRVAVHGQTHMVVWTSLGQDGSYEGVYGRALTASGSPTGNEFRVNTTTLNRQDHPVVAADGTGRLLVVWSSFTGVAAGVDLYAQRYASAQPVPTPAAPRVNALSHSRLIISWAELAGYDLQHYAVFVDANPDALLVTNQMVVISNLVAGSEHTVRMEYVLRDGRRSALSNAGAGTTWGDDFNFDGLPDDWQARYWGANPVRWPAGSADTDGDGASNLQEFLAGTDPTNQASSLRLGMTRNGQGLWLNWNTEPGLVYQVQVSTNAIDWLNLGRARFAPGGTDALAVGGSDLRLYRIIRMR